jgi:UDP-GlcNAc:undecaprenyl-phosphate GlcNAc-1-phosphate transferase
MALPVGDLILAYVRRTMAGKLWYQADKQHLHHRMLELGHSHPRAVGLLWLWSALLAFGMVGIGLTGEPWVISLVVAGLLVAGYLTWKPSRSKVATDA